MRAKMAFLEKPSEAGLSSPGWGGGEEYLSGLPWEQVQLLQPSPHFVPSPQRIVSQDMGCFGA